MPDKTCSNCIYGQVGLEGGEGCDWLEAHSKHMNIDPRPAWFDDFILSLEDDEHGEECKTWSLYDR